MLCNLVLLTLTIRASTCVAIVIGQLLPVRWRIVTNLSKICIAVPHKLWPVCGALLNELVRLLYKFFVLFLLTRDSGRHRLLLIRSLASLIGLGWSLRQGSIFWALSRSVWLFRISLVEGGITFANFSVQRVNEVYWRLFFLCQLSMLRLRLLLWNSICGSSINKFSVLLRPSSSFCCSNFCVKWGVRGCITGLIYRSIQGLLRLLYSLEFFVAVP